MRPTLIAAIVAAAIGGFGAGALTETAGAQQAPPMQAAAPASPAPGERGQDMRAAWRERLRTMALIYRPEDRALSVADVQKIAEAFLLWNGNRTWKITNAAETPDNLVAFTLATGDGGVIARFTMDRRDGRLRRIG
jgi:hypothetical protein